MFSVVNARGIQHIGVTGSGKSGRAVLVTLLVVVAKLSE